MYLHAARLKSVKKGFEESMEVCDKTVPVILICVFENVIKGSKRMLSKLTPKYTALYGRQYLLR